MLNFRKSLLGLLTLITISHTLDFVSGSMSSSTYFPILAVYLIFFITSYLRFGDSILGK